MQSIVRSLEAERDRLRTASGASTEGNWPRIVIPGLLKERGPRLVLQDVSHPGEPVLIHNRRQPANWQEAFWAAGQRDGAYLCVLGGVARAIRSKAGRVEVRGFEEAKWQFVGRVEQEKILGTDHPSPGAGPRAGSREFTNPDPDDTTWLAPRAGASTATATEGGEAGQHDSSPTPR